MYRDLKLPEWTMTNEQMTKMNTTKCTMTETNSGEYLCAVQVSWNETDLIRHVSDQSLLIKAELNPITAKLGWCAYLASFSVLNNIPKCRSSKSTYLLTTSTYIQQNGIADTGADWAMISNRPGNNIKREAAHHSLQWNTVFFSQVNLILLGSHLFLLPPSFVGSVVAFDIKYLGVCLSIRKGV